MKTTRCKFRCAEVRRNATNGGVTLEAIYDPNLNHTDHAFCEATPSGKLEMSLYPADRTEFFKPGAYYHIDISEAE